MLRAAEPFWKRAQERVESEVEPFMLERSVLSVPRISNFTIIWGPVVESVRFGRGQNGRIPFVALTSLSAWRCVDYWLTTSAWNNQMKAGRRFAALKTSTANR